MAQRAVSANEGVLERLFHLRENKTNVRTEVLAGITTFVTMAYIIFVNPNILSEAGLPVDGATYATCIAAAVATLVMGLWANYPFALAPGMGLNAYFTYTIVLGMGYPWQTALGAVFISGVLGFVISVSRVREAIINAIPGALKSAIAAGIGLFIAMIGLKNAGVIVANPATLVDLGNLTEPGTLLTLVGLLITGVLMARNVRGAILLGMLITAVIAIPMGLLSLPSRVFEWPSFAKWATVFGQLDIPGALNVGLLTIVFSFLFVDFFDTAGTFVGVTTRAGLLDEKGNLPRAERAFTADAMGTMIGSVCGTSTVTTYVESAAGVAAGGRTGLTAVVVSVGFLLALFFTPLINAVAGVSAVTAPALILVGALMVQSVLDIKWDDMSDGIPAFIAMIAMPLTFSISDGIALGFIAYPVVKAFSGRAKEVHWIMWVLAVLFALRFLYLD